MVNENDLEKILAYELERIKEQGQTKVNLAEIGRRTGISRAVLRRWKSNGYEVRSSGRRGRPGGSVKLAPFADVIEEMLRSGVSNSSVIMSRLRALGYGGGLTIIKEYVSSHRDLVPAERILAVPEKNRGRRYSTERGDCFQMDWGFVNVVDMLGNIWRCACFAMVCHHCGFRFVEFFPNARQENLFIGMIHAFSVMGLPQRVLTDNMKSVVIRLDAMGNAVFNHDYDEFQKQLGFRTELCKVAHPYTKGTVERLVRYVKDNFVQGRAFINVSDLNAQVFDWCMEKNGNLLRERGLIPNDEHAQEKACMPCLSDPLPLLEYLAPLRSISFDGFVEYEGRRFGVPLSYTAKKARVLRNRDILQVLSVDGVLLSEYRVDWSMRSKTCPGQWDTEMPEEHPTAPVKAVMHIRSGKATDRFSRFAFSREKR